MSETTGENSAPKAIEAPSNESQNGEVANGTAVKIDPNNTKELY